MSYQLFNFHDKEISFDDLNNKGFWCKHGEEKEIAFVKIYKQLQESNLIDEKYSIEIHPEKSLNPFHLDLLINGDEIGDAKIKNSPLFMAKVYKVDPQYALTIDLKDIFNYRNKFLEDGKDIHIFIWVKWEAERMVTPYRTTRIKKMGGIWHTKISKVLLHLEENRNKVSIHWYRENFRKPNFYDFNDPWSQELLDFEPRLVIEGRIKNITSKGFFIPDGQNRRIPSGHSSGSYVLDLSDKSLFEKIYFW